MNSGPRFYKIDFSNEAMKDLCGISRPVLAKIQKIIYIKLSCEPHNHTKPLQYNEQGFRYLKIGEYKVIILIRGNEVRVLSVVSDIFSRQLDE